MDNTHTSDNGKWPTLDKSIENTIATPALLLNYEQMQINCAKFRKMASELGVQLRPHLKTLSCKQAGMLLTNGSCQTVSVCSVSEAEYFADCGFRDILCTKLIEPSVMKRLSVLNDRMDEFHVMIDSLDHVRVLLKYGQSASQWSVYLKVNCGTNRGGVEYDNNDIAELVKEIQHNKIKFTGIYVYTGNAYSAFQKEERMQLTQETVSKLLQVINRLKEKEIEVKLFGLASTPTFADACPCLSQITAGSPGRYIVHDEQLREIGACDANEIAITVATRVIGVYPARRHLVIDCGYTKLSKDKNPDKVEFGRVLQYPFLKLINVFQECSVIEMDQSNCDKDFALFPIGKVLYLSPWNSSATAYCFPSFHVIVDGKIKEIWIRSTSCADCQKVVPTSIKNND